MSTTPKRRGRRPKSESTITLKQLRIAANMNYTSLHALCVVIRNKPVVLNSRIRDFAQMVVGLEKYIPQLRDMWNRDDLIRVPDFMTEELYELQFEVTLTKDVLDILSEYPELEEFISQ